MIRHSEFYLTSKKKWDLIKMVVMYEDRIIKALAQIDNRFFDELNGEELERFKFMLNDILEGRK